MNHHALHLLNHPDANARIALGTFSIGYKLERRRRKNISLYVDAQGVTVRAPPWVGLKQIEVFLHEKAQWVLSQLSAQQERLVLKQKKQIRWENGGEVSYLGEMVYLEMVGKHKGVRLNEALMTLEVGIDASGDSQRDAQRLSVLVQEWMQEQALVYFADRCSFYGHLLGVMPEKVVLTNATSRWGSANERKIIRLHWRLIEFAPDVVDYVVVHELAHLLEMNHSLEFWAHVERVLPDYQKRQQKLKKQVLADW